MRLVVSVIIIVICATAIVSAQQYVGQIAYLDTTCSDPTRNVGGSAMLEATSCAKLNDAYGGFRCNADRTVYSVACTDSICSPANCQFVANVTSCAATPLGVHLHSICYASISDVPIPTTGSSFVARTYIGTTCAAPSTLANVLWGPLDLCIPGEPEDTSSIKAACSGDVVTYSIYNNTQLCSGTPTVQALEGCVVTSVTTATQAVCLAPPATTTAAATAGGATAGGATTTTTTSKTTTTTTSDASVVYAAVLMMLVPLFAVLY